MFILGLHEVGRLSAGVGSGNHDLGNTFFFITASPLVLPLVGEGISAVIPRVGELTGEGPLLVLCPPWLQDVRKKAFVQCELPCVTWLHLLN